MAIDPLFATSAFLSQILQEDSRSESGKGLKPEARGPKPCATAALRRAVILACTLLPASVIMAGCAVLTHYPDQMAGPLRDFETGNLDPAYKAVEKGFDSRLNGLLYLLEGAMILHCMGKTDDSNKVFSQASDVIRKYQEQAVISLSQGAAQAASLLVNEKTLPYEGEPFERVMVDTYKAVNYLCVQDYEGARVEIRRSFEVQEENRDLHQKQIDRMDSEARQKGIQANQLCRDVESRYSDQASVVSKVANPYEDPFAYYISAVVYELNGEYNDALIDLQRVQKLRPGVPCVENDLLRMADRSGLLDTVPDSLRNRQAPRFIDRTRQGELLVIFECGMAPHKVQIMIPLPIPEVGIVPLAFPKYASTPSRIQQAAVYDEQNRLLAQTYWLTDVEAILYRNLHDKMPVLVIKQVLRAAAKGAMARAATKEGGTLGMILASTYNVVTEQADLRSWLTLPRNIQVARIPLQAGEHHLSLCLADSTGTCLQRHPFSVKVEAGRMSVLDARSGPAGWIDLHVN